MDDSTNTNMYTSPAPSPVPEKKTGKVILWILLVIILIAGGVVGGYYYANMNKNKEIDAAKQEGKSEGQKQAQAVADAKKSETPATVTTPAKTSTETTCNADELSLAVSPSANGGAGTIVYDLTFTNTGKRTCTLGGFPGVSLVNENGNMIGSPAERAKNYTEKKLSLAPNAKVKAEMATANSTNFTDGQCKAGATKIRVYPPNDTGYLSVASPVMSWCPGFAISPVLSM